MLEMVGASIGTRFGILVGLAADEPPPLQLGDGSFPSAVTVILCVLFVVALAWGTTRLMGRGPKRWHMTRAVRVAERVPIDRTHAMLVVETEGRRLLIGLSPSELTLLAELEPATEEETAADMQPAPQTPWMRFARSLTNKPKAEPPQTFHLPDETPEDAYRRLSQRVAQRREKMEPYRKDDDPS